MAESRRLKDLGGVVRGGESYRGKQGPNYIPGVSAQTVGSRALWLGSVTLPPRGGRTKAHIHENHESAFYLISGEDVEVWTGELLEHREIAHAGDYLYFPAVLPTTRMSARPVEPSLRLVEGELPLFTRLPRRGILGNWVSGVRNSRK